jgi:lipopolysaccharide export system ATP-binding protein
MTVEQNIAAVLELAEPDKTSAPSRTGAPARRIRPHRLRSQRGDGAFGRGAPALRNCPRLAAQPSIMLLDEPFAGIDPLSISDIRHLVKDLKERGIGVLDHRSQRPRNARHR